MYLNIVLKFILLEVQVKLNVMHCETLNWEREHIDTVWKEVIRLETEMEISHEEEWGIICLLDSLTNYHLCLQPYDLLPHCVDMLPIPVYSLAIHYIQFHSVFSLTENTLNFEIRP